MAAGTGSANIWARLLRAAGTGIVCALALGACGGGSDDDGSIVPPASGLACKLNPALVDPAPPANDPLLAEQWHLNNTGQCGGSAGEDVRAFAAWSLGRGLDAQGSPVRVAVVDDALEIDHEDLAPNVVPGASHDYLTGGSTPAPRSSFDDHGTRVAGIVAARDDNARGVAGVAPRAGLVGLNALATGTGADLADAMTRGFAQTAIYNNSWGAPDDGYLNFADPAWEAAIEHGIENGRGGKGTIYVMPGGNGRNVPVRDASGRTVGTTSDDSNFDGYASQRGVIAVCSVDRFGRRPFYGEAGANILVCAPSSDGSVGIRTTNIGGSYDTGFSGGSAATPIVAGVAALAVAANPALTWRDLRLILARAARQNHPSDASWDLSGPRPYSRVYGFGVVDARAAVELAGGWQSVGGSSNLVRCGPYARAPARALPDASGASVVPVSDTIDVTGCGIGSVEMVEVRFSATDHPYGGDLRIRLFGPGGLRSELAEARSCGSLVPSALDPCRSAYDDWRFATVRFLDRPAGGPWRLEVTDMQAADSGTFQAWSLTLWGRP